MELLLVLLITAGILLLLTLIYLLSIKPNTSRQELLNPFEQTYIAHRGYFDNNLSCPENSLPAFKRAVDAGYGIELDVQLTKDGQMVVFHDPSLKRMCGISKKVTACTYEELKSCRLLGTSHSIPLFTEVLNLINGKVPLVIEIKPEGDYMNTARQLAHILKNYNGIYCIQSFHPFVLRWFRKNHPEVIRGILSTNFRKNKIKRDPFTGFLLTNLLLNWYFKPDYIAYNHKYANEFSYKLCRRLYRPVNAAWTIRSPKELDNNRDTFSIFIFDGFTPQ